MSDTFHGIFLRLGSVALITAMSAVVHAAAKTIPVGQIIFWRSAVALIPIIAYMAWRGQLRSGLKTQNPLSHLTRGAFGCFSMLMSFLSLAYLPVANASALGYLAPLISLPLARVLLGERLTKFVLGSCVLGFVGVLLMLASSLVKPEFDILSLMGIACGLAYAGTMAFVRVHIKAMTATETPASIAFYFAVLCAVVGLATFPLGWVALDGVGVMLLVLAGLLGGAAHIASVEAVARTPVSTLAPFDYTGLIWALGFDILWFANAPDGWSLAGVVAITLAAVLVVLREARGRKGGTMATGCGSPAALSKTRS